MGKLIAKRLSALYVDVPALRPGTVGAYAFAFLSVGVATALRHAVDPYVVGAQFITFFPAIVITTLISGFGAGFFCAVLSTAAADFFVLEPRWAFSFSVEDPANVVDLLLFAPLASFCAFLIGRMRMVIEHEQTEQALRQLRLITDNAPVGIVHCDGQLRYKLINRHHAARLKERLGVMPEQVIGKRLPEVFGDKLFAIFEPYARECLAGKAVEFEVELPYLAGAPQFLQCRLEPEWKDGKVVGLVSAGTDITRLKLAEAALGESEARFRAMFDVSSVGKVEVEPGTGRFLRANAAMCKFVGYGEEELLARTVYDITHPDDRDLDREPLPRMIAGELAGFDLEKRYIRKDGKVVWARTTVNVIRDGFGRPSRNMGVVLDITDRKEREEREHLLMREINHRAKNMLSVVQAIAHQTATKSPEDFIERFTERIQALSANQDLLVRNQWHGVEIEELVRAQLAPFAGLIGPRIVVHGPKLRLNATSGQAIGLALHELATNAGKYGALSTDMGCVDISWGRDNDTFTMSWSEREGPAVSAPKRRGFGTTVMEAMAEHSVDGKVDLDYAPSGLAWRLTCSAEKSLEPLDRRH
jgi:PAS domain S-box-containing protein